MSVTDKTVNKFTKEMIEAFGLENLAIRLTDVDGNLIKQTDNWIDEAEFIKREKQHRARENAQNISRGSNGYKHY